MTDPTIKTSKNGQEGPDIETGTLSPDSQPESGLYYMALIRAVSETPIYQEVAGRNFDLVPNPLRLLEAPIAENFGDRSRLFNKEGDVDGRKMWIAIRNVFASICKVLASEKFSVYFKHPSERIALLNSYYETFLQLAALHEKENFVGEAEYLDELFKVEFDQKVEEIRAQFSRKNTLAFGAVRPEERNEPSMGILASNCRPADSENKERITLTGMDAVMPVVPRQSNPPHRITLTGIPVVKDESGDRSTEPSIPPPSGLQRPSGIKQREPSAAFSRDAMMPPSPRNENAQMELPEIIRIPNCFRFLSEQQEASIARFGFAMIQNSEWKKICAEKDASGETHYAYYHSAGYKIVDEGYQRVRYEDPSGAFYIISEDAVSAGFVKTSFSYPPEVTRDSLLSKFGVTAEQSVSADEIFSQMREAGWFEAEFEDDPKVPPPLPKFFGNLKALFTAEMFERIFAHQLPLVITGTPWVIYKEEGCIVYQYLDTWKISDEGIGMIRYEKYGDHDNFFFLSPEEMAAGKPSEEHRAPYRDATLNAVIEDLLQEISPQSIMEADDDGGDATRVDARPNITDHELSIIVPETDILHHSFRPEEARPELPELPQRFYDELSERQLNVLRNGGKLTITKPDPDNEHYDAEIVVWTISMKNPGTADEIIVYTGYGIEVWQQGDRVLYRNIAGLNAYEMLIPAAGRTPNGHLRPMTSKMIEEEEEITEPVLPQPPIELINGIPRNSVLAHLLDDDGEGPASNGWRCFEEFGQFYFEKDNAICWAEGSKICFRLGNEVEVLYRNRSEYETAGPVSRTPSLRVVRTPSKPAAAIKPQAIVELSPDDLETVDNSGDDVAAPTIRAAIALDKTLPSGTVVTSAAEPVRGVVHTLVMPVANPTQPVQPTADRASYDRLSRPSVPPLSMLASVRAQEKAADSSRPQMPKEPSLMDRLEQGDRPTWVGEVMESHRAEAEMADRASVTSLLHTTFPPPVMVEERGFRSWIKKHKKGVVVAVMTAIAGVTGGVALYKNYSTAEEQTAHLHGFASSASTKAVKSAKRMVANEEESQPVVVMSPDDPIKDFGPDTKPENINSLANKTYELPEKIKTWLEKKPSLRNLVNMEVVVDGKTGVGKQIFTILYANAHTAEQRKAIHDLETEFDLASGDAARMDYGAMSKDQLDRLAEKERNNIYKSGEYVGGGIRSEIDSLQAMGILPEKEGVRLGTTRNGVSVEKLNAGGIALYKNFKQVSGLENPHFAQTGRPLVVGGTALVNIAIQRLYNAEMDQRTGMLNPQPEVPKQNFHLQDEGQNRFGMMNPSSPSYTGVLLPENGHVEKGFDQDSIGVLAGAENEEVSFEVDLDELNTEALTTDIDLTDLNIEATSHEVDLSELNEDAVSVDVDLTEMEELAAIDAGWDEEVDVDLTAMNNAAEVTTTKLELDLSDLEDSEPKSAASTIRANTKAVREELAAIDAGWEDEPAPAESLDSKIVRIKGGRRLALLENGEVFVPHLSEAHDGSVRQAIKNGFLKECATTAQMGRIEAIIDQKLRYSSLDEFEAAPNGTYAKLSPEMLQELHDALHNPETGAEAKGDVMVIRSSVGASAVAITSGESKAA